jgi:large subunit ribosomal protein L21
MEAIVKISGKQYRVAEGARLTVDRLASKVGDEVSFGDVLLLADGAKATIGKPLVEGAAVTARVVAATRGPKIIVYKYKAKKRYRRTQGARAEQSLLEVIAVSGPGSKKTAKVAKADTAEAKAEKVESTAKAEKVEAKTARAESPKPKTAAEGAEPAPEAPE